MMEGRMMVATSRLGREAFPDLWHSQNLVLLTYLIILPLIILPLSITP
jgi:hypothetical protein